MTCTAVHPPSSKGSETSSKRSPYIFMCLEAVKPSSLVLAHLSEDRPLVFATISWRLASTSIGIKRPPELSRRTAFPQYPSDAPTIAGLDCSLPPFPIAPEVSWNVSNPAQHRTPRPVMVDSSDLGCGTGRSKPEAERAQFYARWSASP